MDHTEAQRLAGRITLAANFTCPKSEWVQVLERCDHPQWADRAISDGIANITDGRYYPGTFTRRYHELVQRNEQSGPLGAKECCDETGFSHVERPSPVTGIDQFYAVPCGVCRGGEKVTERVIRWNEDNKP